MNFVRKLVRKVVNRVRSNDFVTTHKRKSKSKKAERRDSVQIISYHQRRGQGTLISTPIRQSESQPQLQLAQKKSSEELDERLETIRARRRQSSAQGPINLDEFVYVGSLLHVSMRAADGRDGLGCVLPPLFAASNISTFIERLTFSHTMTDLTDQTPPATVVKLSPPRASQPALPCICGDDNCVAGTHNIDDRSIRSV